LSTAEAAATYLKLVDPPNQALIRLKTYVALHADEQVRPQYLSAVRSLSKKMSDKNQEFLVALRRQPWPAGVRSTVGELVAQVIEEQRGLKAMATAPTAEAFLAGAGDVSSADKGAATLLRQQLGISAQPA
jgi:hypothetical protein